MRGRVVDLSPDAGDAVFNAISLKYTGQPFDPGAEPFARFVATVEVERHTFQDPDDAPGTTL